MNRQDGHHKGWCGRVQGIKLGDLMYVTSRGMSTAVQGVTKQMEALSGALQVGRKAERQEGQNGQEGWQAERN